MAKVLQAGESTLPSPLAAYLRETLPDTFVVVSDAVVQQRELDAIVVGPGGLILIATEGNPAAGDPAPGSETAAPAPTYEQLATASMRAFLNEMFPARQLAVRYLTTSYDPTADPPGWTTTSPAGEQPEDVAAAVVRIQAASGDVLDSAEARDEVADTLRVRRLTVSQRVAQPFVFRGSGPFGVTASAYTLQEVVRHIDRHPGDGIYHLANGTLARWLEEQGAADLAKLARTAVEVGRSDRRRALETFLLGTGLVERPKLMTQPKSLDMGYAIAGETLMGRLRLRRGPGRGYLFGTLEPAARWLDVQPRSFAGQPLDVAVTVDSLSLMISPVPYEAPILVASSASAEPVAVPVRVHVVGAPSSLNRFVHRPLVGLVLALLPAALIGLLWALTAPPLPAAVIAALGLAPPAAWALAVTAAWAFIGLIRGLVQPRSWPALYAARRWFTYLAIACPITALLGLFAGWWWQASFGPIAGPSGLFVVRCTLGGLALAILPATIGSLRRWPEPVVLKPKSAIPLPSFENDRAAPDTRLSSMRRLKPRVVWSALGIIALIAALVFVPQLARLDWQEVRSQRQIVSAQTWLGTQAAGFNASANSLLDRLYLYYYDHRAPLVPTPEPSAALGTAPAATGGK